MSRTTRIYTHDDCLKHVPPGGFPERVERLQAITGHFDSGGEASAGRTFAGRTFAGRTFTGRTFAGRIEVVRPVLDPAALDAVDSAVRKAHDERYVDRLRAATRRGDGVIDSADNPLSAGTWDASVAAVGTALAACDWAYGDGDGGGTGGESRHAFAAIRPPGHHATASKAMGFCYFNNVAAAAEGLLQRVDVSRVAILDFDVHHGNGTQDIFWRRGDVFYLSSHQFPFYPGSGRADESGVGDGEGATLNVPLAAGVGDREFLDALDEMLTALRGWRPDALLVSAGFDAWQDDPLGGLRVSLEGYEAAGTRLAALADEYCGGRFVSLLEGGYDVASLPDLVASYCRGAAT